MNRQNHLHYCRAYVIVHGRSKYHIANFIKTNLRVRMTINGRENGKKSIVINALPKYLKQSQYKNLEMFAEENSIEYDRNTKELKTSECSSLWTEISVMTRFTTAM